MVSTASVSNGFFSTGSMLSLCCRPTPLTWSSTAAPRVLINCTEPAKPAVPSATIEFDRIGGIERDIVKQQVGRALRRGVAQRCTVGEFHGVDTGAVQHQRQELPDAGLIVDHVAERGAGRRQRRRRNVSRCVGGRRGR